MATTTDLPTVADFLADASDRLESTARLLSPRRDTDPAAAIRELSRAVAALGGAVRELAQHTDTDTDQENRS